MYYLLLLVAVIMLSLQFAVNKYYQNKNGNEISVSFLYTCLTGFTAALFFLVMNRFQVAFTPFSILCALGVSLLCLSYTLLGLRIFAIGNFSLYMMFLMLGGMILPFLYGIIFLGDADALNPLSFAARMVGILLMTVSLVVSNVRTGKNGNTEKHKSVIILYVCVFFLNGFVSVISKLHQIEKNRAVVSNNNFVFWTNLFTGIVSGIVLLIICLRKKIAPILAKDFGNGKLMLAVAICAALGGGSYLLQLIVAGSSIPASVQYPFITGGSVVLSAASGRIFFGEKLPRKEVYGVLIAFLATFLFLV